jgi:multiple RNA-binding domain-containing protein 1
VRIALGETQVIAETKKALTNAGVNVASLEEYAAGKFDGVKRKQACSASEELAIWFF